MAGRAGETVVHRALVGMEELVRLERIVVDHPAAAQVALDRRQVHVVVVASTGELVEAVQQEVEADDLEGGQRVVGGRLVGRVGGQGARAQRERQPAKKGCGMRGHRSGSQEFRDSLGPLQRDCISSTAPSTQPASQIVSASGGRAERVRCRVVPWRCRAWWIEGVKRAGPACGHGVCLAVSLKPVRTELVEVPARGFDRLSPNGGDGACQITRSGLPSAGRRAPGGW